MRIQLVTLCLLLLAAEVFLPARASAQTPAGPPGTVQLDATASSVTFVEKRTRTTVNRKGDVEDATADETDSHPTLRLGRYLTIAPTVRIEGDIRAPTPDIALDSTQFNWWDRRIGVQGTMTKRIAFEVSRELRNDIDKKVGTEKTAWRDLFVNVHVIKGVQVEGGQFKLPFGHESLTGESRRDFVEQSLASRVLSPGYDPGIMVHGRLFSRTVQYQVGYFTRDGRNARTSQIAGGHHARVARIVVSPFGATPLRMLAPLAVGVAVADSSLDDQLGIRGRTVLGDSVFFNRQFVNGRRRRVGLEATWALGSVGASAEYITLSEERNGLGFDAADLTGIEAKAWYLAGTWILTGEQKRGRVEPRHPLLHGGFGAIEIAGRVEKLGFGSAPSPLVDLDLLSPGRVYPNADHVLTGGVNWYVNHYFKIQADLIREQIDDPSRSPAPTAGGRFASRVIRFQFRL